MPSEKFFFCFFENIITFEPTNQIFLSFESVWFLLRRVKRLGSAKPWQPIHNIRITVPKPNPGKPGDDKNFNTDNMNSIHLTHNNFIMPLMPMRMCR
jgi:hypothetical protein